MTVVNPEICKFCNHRIQTTTGVACSMSREMIVRQQQLRVRSAGQEYEIAGRTFSIPTGSEVPENCPLVLEQVIGDQ